MFKKRKFKLVSHPVLIFKRITWVELTSLGVSRVIQLSKRPNEMVL